MSMNASTTRLLSGLVLLNAILMASIVDRYKSLQQAWSEHQMAHESYTLLRKDRFH
tara:strand:+ start:249 stop:416 length:168 start_codon:yes stop_codon:yes gene_type:complete